MRMATETGTFIACHRVITQCLKSWKVKPEILAALHAFRSARRSCMAPIRLPSHVKPFGVRQPFVFGLQFLE